MRTAGEALPCRRQQNRHLRHGGGGDREGEREGGREGERRREGGGGGREREKGPPSGPYGWRQEALTRATQSPNRPYGVGHGLSLHGSTQRGGAGHPSSPDGFRAPPGLPTLPRTQLSSRMCPPNAWGGGAATPRTPTHTHAHQCLSEANPTWRLLLPQKAKSRRPDETEQACDSSRRRNARGKPIGFCAEPSTRPVHEHHSRARAHMCTRPPPGPTFQAQTSSARQPRAVCSGTPGPAAGSQAATVNSWAPALHRPNPPPHSERGGCPHPRAGSEQNARERAE